MLWLKHVNVSKVTMNTKELVLHVINPAKPVKISQNMIVKRVHRVKIDKYKYKNKINIFILLYNKMIKI